MELADREFLNKHINNYETAQSGFLRNLDLDIMKTYESIYRKYIDPNFILTIWCGFCRMDMVLRLYAHYDKVLDEDLMMIQKQIIEPKKRGRKPKSNG